MDDRSDVIPAPGTLASADTSGTTPPQRRSRWLLSLLLPGLLGCGGAAPKTWVVYYGVDPKPLELAGFGLIVVDPGYRGDIATLKRNKAKVLGYISLGELNRQRPEFQAAHDAGLLLVENANWPGAWMVDIRNPRWRTQIVETIASDLVARGFDGFFLDTIDSPLALEHSDPQRYKGMRAAAVTLIAALADRFPTAMLLQNGGIELAGDLAGKVDAIAVESTRSTWDFAARAARLRTDSDRRQALDWLGGAKKRNPKLQYYALDYWDPDDVEGIARIYRDQRAAGMVPYVATIALDRVVQEPAARR